MANQNPAGIIWRTIEDTAAHFKVKPRQVYRWLEKTEATASIRRKIDPDTGKKLVHIPTATAYVNALPHGRPRKTS